MSYSYEVGLKLEKPSTTLATKLYCLITWTLWGIPVLLSLRYVYMFGVNVPWVDQFDFIPLLEKRLRDVLLSPEFYAQHLEHKIYLPRLIMLFLARLTDYNVKAEMFFIQFLLLLSTGIFFLELKRHFQSKDVFLWLAPIPLLVFSLRQHQNMLFGFQLTLICTHFFNLLTLYLVYLLQEDYSDKRKSIIFWGAMISAIFASFSTAGGLFLWPVGCLEILLLRLTWSSKRQYLIAWIIGSLLIGFLYLYNYQKPPVHPNLFFAVEHPYIALTYLFVYLGSSLFWHADWAFSTGLILSVISSTTLYILYRQNRINENLFWISVMVLAYLTAIIASISRSGFGVSQALLSKYTTFSIPLVLAQYILLLDLFIYRRRDISTIGLGFVLSLIILGSFTSYFQALAFGKNFYAVTSGTAFTLLDYQNQPNEALSKSHPDTPRVRSGAAILQKLQYSVFSEPQKYAIPNFGTLSLRPTQTIFWFDSVNKNSLGFGTLDTVKYFIPSHSIVVDSKSELITMAGWAVDAGNNGAAGGIYLKIGDKIYPGSYGKDRKDIADKYGIPSYRFSGFEIQIPTSTISPEVRLLSIRILSADKLSYYEHKQQILIEKSDQQLVLTIGR